MLESALVFALALDPWELTAVALAIAYLLLAVRQNPWCWGAALVSVGIYLVLFWRAGLYMESALQAFYLVMAVYGWRVWRHGGTGGGTLPVSRWPARLHAVTIAAVLLLSAASGWLLSRYSNAELPYLDSFTTWAALVTTWMAARKILENWIYWFVIDSASIYLYLSRDLFATVGLFALYLVIIVFGFMSWRRSLSRAAA
jgi:nicotinamide mononucleotide transporter